MSVLGIDLGTTNTVSAIDQEVVALDHGAASSPILPSVVAFLPSGATLVGAAARRRRVIDPKNTIYSAKRLIGRRWHSWDARHFSELYPFDVVEDGNGEATFQTRRGLVSPTEISAIVLQTLLRRSGRPAPPPRTVITVPSVFQERERRATLEAAARAGLVGVELLDEPVATALAYHAAGEALGLTAVYDLGGGTFDLAVVDCDRRPMRVIAHGGDLYLGGDDLDLALSRWAARELLRLHGWDAQGDVEVLDRLVGECEAAKIRLSEEPETALDIGRIDPLIEASEPTLILTRELLDELVRELVQRTFALCDQVLQQAGISPSSVETVLLAGGSARLALIQSSVEAYFGRPPRREIDPLLAVAIGASSLRSS